MRERGEEKRRRDEGSTGNREGVVAGQGEAYCRGLRGREVARRE
jgi:hypothetical protein